MNLDETFGSVGDYGGQYSADEGDAVEHSGWTDVDFETSNYADRRLQGEPAAPCSMTLATVADPLTFALTVRRAL